MKVLILLLQQRAAGAAVKQIPYTATNSSEFTIAALSVLKAISRDIRML